MAMKTPRAKEQRRLEAIRSLHILDSMPEEVFDRLTRFAATVCQTPIAVITIVDEHRQWFKSAFGLELTETPRDISFCTHTIRSKDLYMVHDATRDPLFSTNPLVLGEPGIRFYAGVPLLMEDGLALGSLAVIDRIPRTLTDAQLSTLALLAEQVMVHIQLRHQREDLRRAAQDREQMHAEMKSHTEHLRAAQRIAKIGSWELHSPQQTLVLSEEVYRIFGLSQPRPTEPISAFMRSVHRDDRQRLQQAIDTALAALQPLDVEHKIVRPGGEIRYVHQRGEVWLERDGQKIMSGTVQDVTEQRLVQGRQRLLDNCIARLNDIIMITEAQPLTEPGPRIVFVNHAFEKHTGYTPEEVIGRSPRLLQGPHTDRAALDRIGTALQRQEPVNAEVINYTKDGREFWLEIDIAPVMDESGKISHFVAIERDISQRKTAEADIERLAFFDPLTRLPNRRLLLDRLQHTIESVRRNRCTGALLFIDLDHFKGLNDTLGHDKGDLLLQQVARRLENCVRKSNTVARFGGDEFVIMLDELNANPQIAAAQAEVVAEKVLDSFSRAFMLGEVEYHSTPSIGVALFGEELNNIDELFKRADLAMYQSKASGRNTVRFFDPAMQAVVNARVALEREFRNGLRRHEFVLHYQPQSNGYGQVTGAEALVRWRHPKHGLVYPDEFIWLAEETGLILDLGRWVLLTACKQMAEWRTQAGVQPNGVPMSVAVNISARQFRHPDFVRQAMSIIEATGVDPHYIKFELTESMLIDDVEDTIAKMTALRARGVRFSLDDFGTGYSSLAYLKRLPLDQLKIDRSFVRDILTDPNDAAIAQTIIALGQILGLEVIAEGVETDAQRDFLARHGCHAYQGALFSTPMPAEQF
jgi:diguanylate cyclase (GGDEF)-like protein/PAS domain S-box-containing protein